MVVSSRHNSQKTKELQIYFTEKIKVKINKSNFTEMSKKIWMKNYLSWPVWAGRVWRQLAAAADVRRTGESSTDRRAVFCSGGSVSRISLAIIDLNRWGNRALSRVSAQFGERGESNCESDRFPRVASSAENSSWPCIHAGVVID